MSRWRRYAPTSLFPTSLFVAAYAAETVSEEMISINFAKVSLVVTGRVQISKATGGPLFEVSKKEPEDKICAEIEEQLRNQYSIAHTPEKKHRR